VDDSRLKFVIKSLDVEAVPDSLVHGVFVPWTLNDNFLIAILAGVTHCFVLNFQVVADPLRRNQSEAVTCALVLVDCTLVVWPNHRGWSGIPHWGEQLEVSLA
jgi:hypothetical protein